MVLFENSFPGGGSKGLRYGVIYVNLPFANRASVVEQLRDSRILSRLRSLTGFDVKIIDIPEESEPVIVARRINVGNAGKEALLRMPMHDLSLSDIEQFACSVIDVVSPDEGDKLLTPGGLELHAHLSDDVSYLPLDEMQSLPSAAEPAALPQKAWLKKIKRKFAKKRTPADHGIEGGEAHSLDYLDEPASAPAKESRDSVAQVSPRSREIEAEEEEVLTLEQKCEMALLAIQAQIIEYVRTYHADPSQLINTLLKGKIVVGQNNHLSPLVVNNDLKIVLPHYNEVEVKMPAMCRAIYILFLNHHEGIALRDVVDHRAELEDIYSMVMPGRSEGKAREAIDNLVDPMSNTLNEYISKIKRCFKLCILDEELAASYIITGKRGEPYRIALAPELITLPRAVTGE